jgi:hypothetical protein
MLTLCSVEFHGILFEAKSVEGLDRLPVLESGLDGLRSDFAGLRGSVQQLETVLMSEDTEFRLNPVKPLEGMIASLTHQYGGNVHDRGIVTITSSSVYSDNDKYHPQNAANLRTSDFFRSKKTPSQWICWDFNGLRIRPTHYSIRRVKEGNPKTWIVEGSLEGSVWTELDRHTNSESLNGHELIVSFLIARPIVCRMIRLRQTGPTHRNDHMLTLCCVEFHGVLFEPKSGGALGRVHGLESGLDGLRGEFAGLRDSVQQLESVRTLEDREFRLNPALPLEGIISSLTRQHGGHVHDRGIVTITSLSVCSDDDRFHPRNAANLNAPGGFCSKSEAGQWICWDFKEMRIRPTHYSIQHLKRPIPKTWIVEGSFDGSLWVELDRQTNNDSLNGTESIVSFPIARPIVCRMIRLSQLTENHQKDHQLGMSCVEFHGDLFEPRPRSWQVDLHDSVHRLETTLCMEKIHYRLKSAAPFDGIIAALTRQYGGNVHDKSIVTITSRSVSTEAEAFHPRNIANFGGLGFFCSKNEPGQWVCWDFKDLRIRPSHYSIQGVKQSNIRTWIVEGSIDGTAWAELDGQIDSDSLNGDGLKASFPVSHPIVCRMIRLRQTGQTDRNDHILSLCSVEFLGLLFRP